jgi:hypothetical protein
MTIGVESTARLEERICFELDQIAANMRLLRDAAATIAAAAEIMKRSLRAARSCSAATAVLPRMHSTWRRN